MTRTPPDGQADHSITDEQLYHDVRTRLLGDILNRVARRIHDGQQGRQDPRDLDEQPPDSPR